MQLVVGLFVFFISSSAFAVHSKKINHLKNFGQSHASKSCDEIKIEQNKLAIIGANLLNANTTRTAEGGPYHPSRIKNCYSGGCVVEEVKTPLLKYMPEHPDADRNGYVAFPNVDVKKEYAVFNRTAAKLRALGKSGACGSAASEDEQSILISYSKKPALTKEDFFGYDENNQVVSWVRTDANGKSISWTYEVQ